MESNRSQEETNEKGTSVAENTGARVERCVQINSQTTNEDKMPIDPLQSQSQLTKDEKVILSKIIKLKNRLQEIKRESWVPINCDAKNFPAADRPLKDQKNIIIVSNRLLVTLKRTREGRWMFEQSGGGLASAMRGIKNIRLIYIGWPGCEVAAEDQDFVRSELGKIGCIPVFLSDEIQNKYYNGFSNNVLWPLFHFIPLETDQIKMSEEEWQAYRTANMLFAEAIMKFAPKKNDVIWIHDYHLMLVPGLLRQRIPTAQIGFFLHIPFPNAEFFKVLPQRSEILRGLLASNLVGFHLYDYAIRFKNSCIRILQGCEETPQCINDNGRMTAIGTHPIGIDPEIWFDAIENNHNVRDIIASLKSKFKDKRIVLGVDRMDYVKGLEHKLFAWELFLKNCPEWVGKVVLIQISVPSRKGIRKYQELAKTVHTRVGSINGQFSTVDYVPIISLDQTINFENLAALYHVADACLITSLRDGMNLVAYEYVAAQGRRGYREKNDQSSPTSSSSNSACEGDTGEVERPGILLLSEFTGAAQSLGAGAILLNPWDVKKLAEQIKYALEMQDIERKVYHRYALKYVKSHTAEKWATDFLARLQEAHVSIGMAPIVPKKFQEEPVMEAWKNSTNRLIILGLVGTITQVRPRDMSYQHFLKFASIPEESKDAIRKMSIDDRTQIVIVTQRGRAYAEEIIGNIGCSIFAENGYFSKKKGETAWSAAHGREGTDDLSWMIETESVMKYFMERTPNAFIERSEGSINFEYQDSDPVHGEDQARDLMETLKKGALRNTATQMVNTMRSVHVRLAGVRKVDLVRRVIDELEKTHGFPPDFVFVAGDFLKDDEALFQNINNSTSQSARKLKCRRRKLSAMVLPQSPVLGPHFPEPHTYEETLLPPATKVHTCCIPRKASHAQRYLDSPDELNAFLIKLAENLPQDATTKHQQTSEVQGQAQASTEGQTIKSQIELPSSTVVSKDSSRTRATSLPGPAKVKREREEEVTKLEIMSPIQLSMDSPCMEAFNCDVSQGFRLK